MRVRRVELAVAGAAILGLAGACAKQTADAPPAPPVASVALEPSYPAPWDAAPFDAAGATMSATDPQPIYATNEWPDDFDAGARAVPANTRDAAANAARAQDGGVSEGSSSWGELDSGATREAGSAEPDCLQSPLSNDPELCQESQEEWCESVQAVEACRHMATTRDKSVFDAFVECLTDALSDGEECETAGGVEGELASCEREADAVACKSSSRACHVYEGCEALTVEGCNQRIAPYNEQWIAFGASYFECGQDPLAYVQ